MLLLHLSTSPVMKRSMTISNGRDEKKPPGFYFKLLRSVFRLTVHIALRYEALMMIITVVGKAHFRVTDRKTV